MKVSLKQKAGDVGLNINTYRIATENMDTKVVVNLSIKRYQFRRQIDGKCLFNAVGIKEANIWLDGYCNGHSDEKENERRKY